MGIIPNVETPCMVPMETKAPAHHLGVWRDCGREMAQERREVQAILMSSQQEAEIIQDRTGFITEETRLKLHLHCCVGPRACIFLPTTAHRKNCVHPLIMETPSRLSDAFLVQGFIHSSPTCSHQHPDLGGRLLKKRELKTFGGVISPKKSNEQAHKKGFLPCYTEHTESVAPGSSIPQEKHA